MLADVSNRVVRLATAAGGRDVATTPAGALVLLGRAATHCRQISCQGYVPAYEDVAYRGGVVRSFARTDSAPAGAAGRAFWQSSMARMQHGVQVSKGGEAVRPKAGQFCMGGIS